ncbi:MAG: YraN family protein [Prevotellaceae bacterium]|nr:YraN family protein [Prevotellaceae bacterium]
MAGHNDLGKQGEEAAARFLSALEYRLLARNWRAGRLELDLVAEDYGEVVFVEVKTRTHASPGEALEAVGREKRENMLRAAAAFMAYYHLDKPFRFDIVTLTGTGARNFRIDHHKRAFDWHTVRGKGCGYFR